MRVFSLAKTPSPDRQPCFALFALHHHISFASPSPNPLLHRDRVGPPLSPNMSKCHTGCLEHQAKELKVISVLFPCVVCVSPQTSRIGSETPMTQSAWHVFSFLFRSQLLSTRFDMIRGIKQADRLGRSPASTVPSFFLHILHPSNQYHADTWSSATASFPSTVNVT